MKADSERTGKAAVAGAAHGSVTLYHNPLLGWQLWRGDRLLRHAMDSSVRLWASLGLVRRVGRDSLVLCSPNSAINKSHEIPPQENP